MYERKRRSPRTVPWGTPDETFVSNAIVVEFVKEMTVRHLVERLAKIKQNDVFLMT